MNLRMLGAALAIGAMLPMAPATVSAQAAGNAHSAEKLRQLDIMLMVTNLRCRRLGQDFDRDYEHFSTNHLQTMNAASQELRTTFAAGRNRNAQNRVLDTISTSMANRYGTGHPWLECAELREIAGNLAAQRDVAVLLVAADELLAEERPISSGMLAVYEPR